jgi:HEPN domain-containing protein/predicted nucleotidyltransferase
MVEARDIIAVANAIAEKFEPEKIILFGSYAYGTPTEDSDVDLFVIKRHRGHGGWRIRMAVDRTIPMDILVRSPAEVRRRLELEDYFIMDVVEQGIVLHERNNSRVGQEGRNRLRRRLRTSPLEKAQSFEPICYHCQQCVEKYLKARLNEAGVTIIKTHDFEVLLTQLEPIEPLWTVFRKRLDRLTDYAVAVRYPGSFAGSADAKEAYSTCLEIRSLARSSLGLRTAK